MPDRQKILSGIHEVGTQNALDDDASRTALGKTTPEGITISWDETTFTVESGQDDFPLEEIVNAVQTEWSFTLQSGTLGDLAFALGLPASALTGDITGGTDEVLTINLNEIGSAATDSFYLKGPGAGPSPRVAQIAKGKVFIDGDFSLSRDANQQISVRIQTLVPDSGSTVAKITDPAS